MPASLIPLESSEMSSEQCKSAASHCWLATIAVMAGVAVTGFSVTELRADHLLRFAQATPGTPPLQGTPAIEDTTKPAESKPGGTRPTTPAPEPAHPDPQAQKAGVSPALPSAPAEKIAPPINDK